MEFTDEVPDMNLNPTSRSEIWELLQQAEASVDRAVRARDYYRKIWNRWMLDNLRGPNEIMRPHLGKQNPTGD